MSISETEETQIYTIINEALLCLCEQKPNDPVDFLSRKMLELIGEDPSNAIRLKQEEEEITKQKTTKNALITPEFLAIESSTEKFEDNYRITEKISKNVYLLEDLKHQTETKKAVRIISKEATNVFISDKRTEMLVNLSHQNCATIYQILNDEQNIYVIQSYCPSKDL